MELGSSYNTSSKAQPGKGVVGTHILLPSYSIQALTDFLPYWK